MTHIRPFGTLEGDVREDLDRNYFGTSVLEQPILHGKTPLELQEEYNHFTRLRMDRLAVGFPRRDLRRAFVELGLELSGSCLASWYWGLWRYPDHWPVTEVRDDRPRDPLPFDWSLGSRRPDAFHIYMTGDVVRRAWVKMNPILRWQSRRRPWRKAVP